jgi:ABC-type molybdate transport system substrate-binding protein
MALNNQTALLKVVNNLVYFSIKADTVPGTNGGESVTTYTTTPQTIPVGIVMSVLPQINENGKLKSGSAWIVPENMHEQLRQDAVLLNPGKDSAAAIALLSFLKSEKAKKIIASYGYQF